MAHGPVVGEDGAVARLPAILRATHPVPAAAVTLLSGAVVAARADQPATAVLATASVLAGQLSIGWSNDYLDREQDAAAGRSDKPIPAGEVSARTVWWAAVAAAATSVGLSAALGPAEAALMALAVGSAWVYNAGLQATALSWVPYVVSFGLAPVYLWVAADGTLPPGWVVGGAALLGVAGHLTNVLPDLEADRARAARGLPHLLGPRWSLALAAASLAGAEALVLWFSPAPGPASVAAGALAGVLILAVLVAGAADRAREAFALTVAAAGAVVANLLLAG